MQRGPRCKTFSYLFNFHFLEFLPIVAIPFVPASWSFLRPSRRCGGLGHRPRSSGHAGRGGSRTHDLVLRRHFLHHPATRCPRRAWRRRRYGFRRFRDRVGDRLRSGWHGQQRERQWRMQLRRRRMRWKLMNRFRSRNFGRLWVGVCQPTRFQVIPHTSVAAIYTHAGRGRGVRNLEKRLRRGGKSLPTKSGIKQYTCVYIVSIVFRTIKAIVWTSWL